MSRRTSTSRLGSEFDPFLFALIGEDKNGLSLSGASALARMDLDPWQEAAKLATLPTGTAALNVAALFQALPDKSLTERDRGTMATRLIALLPHRPSSEIESPLAPVNVGDAIRSLRSAGALFFVVALALLAFQFVMARHDSLAPVDASHATPVGPPQTLPPGSDA